MIIIKILRKRILINLIFDNRRCQIIPWWQLKEPLCRAWFGCSPSEYTPSDGYMEYLRAIQMTSRAALKGFSQAALLWKPARQHTTKRRTQLLLCHHLSADKLSSGKMFSLTPHGCRGWATFAHRHTFRRCFRYSEIAVKIGHSQKVSRLELHAPVKIVTDVFRPSVNSWTPLWSLKCTTNVSFRVWHLIFLNNSNVDWTWNLAKRIWLIFNQHAEFCCLGNPM